MYNLEIDRHSTIAGRAGSNRVHNRFEALNQMRYHELVLTLDTAAEVAVVKVKLRGLNCSKKPRLLHQIGNKA